MLQRRAGRGRIAPGLIAADYWEGRDHYVTELLSAPNTAITYDVRVPFDPLLYPGNFGRNVGIRGDRLLSHARVQQWTRTTRCKPATWSRTCNWRECRRT